MVRFTAELDDGKILVGLGISRGNLNKLLAGKPVLVAGESIDQPKIDIYIFFGETEQDLYEMVKPSIKPGETKITIDADVDVKQ